jgi:hypothetical protein
MCYLTQLNVSVLNLIYFIFILFYDAVSELRLYSVKWKGNKWIMSWKEFGRKQSWPNFKVLSRHLPRETYELEGIWKEVVVT